MMNSFDRSKLNDYAERMLSRFVNAFPGEEIYLLQNSEDYYSPDKDRFIGAWVMEWLCPTGGYDWNVILSSSEHQLKIRWVGDHEHFGNWDHIEGDPEAETCMERLAEIFDEKLCYVTLYQGEKIIIGHWCGPEEVETFIRTEPATSYRIITWRGTFDNTVKGGFAFEPTFIS